LSHIIVAHNCRTHNLVLTLISIQSKNLIFTYEIPQPIVTIAMYQHITCEMSRPNTLTNWNAYVKGSTFAYTMGLLSDIDMSSIVVALQPIHLVTVNLSYNHISDEGAILIAKSLFKTLRVLGLGFNNIGDEGAIAIGNQLKHPSSVLCTLDLCRNKITDVGASHLVDCTNNTTLTFLQLIGNRGIKDKRLLYALNGSIRKNNQRRQIHAQCVTTRMVVLISFLRANQNHEFQDTIFQHELIMQPIVNMLSDEAFAHISPDHIINEMQSQISTDPLEWPKSDIRMAACGFLFQAKLHSFADSKYCKNVVRESS
jgi:hypothetical protein